MDEDDWVRGNRMKIIESKELAVKFYVEFYSILCIIIVGRKIIIFVL